MTLQRGGERFSASADTTAQAPAASLEMTNNLLIEEFYPYIIFCPLSENRALIKQSKLRPFYPNRRAFRLAAGFKALK